MYIYLHILADSKTGILTVRASKKNQLLQNTVDGTDRADALGRDGAKCTTNYLRPFCDIPLQVGLNKRMNKKAKLHWELTDSNKLSKIFLPIRSTKLIELRHYN